MLRLVLIGILTSFINLPLIGNTWKEALANKRGVLNLYWNSSTPFVYFNADGEMEGMEYELLVSFQGYLREKHGIELTYNWIETETFYDVIKEVRNCEIPNCLGSSSISITEERKEFVSFTDPYLPDITVLVSSNDTPIMEKPEEMKELLKDMMAVTIEGTKYDNLLLNIKEEYDVDFEILYIQSHQSILDFIAQGPKRLGFIDLISYLKLIETGREYTRHNSFTDRGGGYGFALSLNTDWMEPWNEFINDVEIQEEIKQVTSKYLGAELFEFIDNVYDDEQLGTLILTREKQIQLELIRNANLKLAQERAIRQILIVGITLSVILVIVIGFLFYNNKKTTRLLFKQKKQIEMQQEDIQIKNEQLINRNAQLIALNEEKNNLVRILAHDLKSPLNQIIGLSKVLPDRMDMKSEDKELLNKIGEGADRINQMITKILDVDGLEGNQILIFHERVLVKDIMRDVASYYRETASKKEIDIILEFCEEEKVLETDHLLLFLVLENLVSNAIKFSKPKKQVLMKVECHPDAVIFKVIDQGPGFTEKDEELMFNRFQKLSAEPTGDESSTGLGLSIVKQYTKDLGGEVWLETAPGKGSTFFIKLPTD